MLALDTEILYIKGMSSKETWDASVLKMLIQREGRTTVWLANQVGIHPGTVRNILGGHRPSRPVLKLMALALHSTEDELLSKTPSAPRKTA